MENFVKFVLTQEPFYTINAQFAFISSTKYKKWKKVRYTLLLNFPYFFFLIDSITCKNRQWVAIPLLINLMLKNYQLFSTLKGGQNGRIFSHFFPVHGLTIEALVLCLLPFENNKGSNRDWKVGDCNAVWFYLKLAAFSNAPTLKVS